MAIIPTKDNFGIMPTGSGVRFDGGPKPVDVTRNTRVLAQGLMAFEKIRDENDKTEALMKANQWTDYTSQVLQGYQQKRGYHAYKNEDGMLVLDTLWEDAETERNRIIGGMSANQRKYFELYSANTDRSFRREAQNHFDKEYRAWEDTTYDQAQEQRGTAWLMNGDEVALNDFHGLVLKRSSRKMDQKQAMVAANMATSEMLVKRIGSLLDDRDPDAAQKLLEKYKPIFTGDDYIKVSTRINQFVRADEAMSYGKALSMGGGGGITVNNNSDFKAQRFSVESYGGKTNADGTPLINKNKNGTIDVGKYQLNEVNWEAAAKAAGEKLDRERILKDSAYADKLGEAWVDKVFLPEAKASFGNDWMKIHAAYNVGIQGVKNRVKTHGDKWRDALPDVTKKQLAALERTGNATATPEQRKLMIHEKYRHDPQSESIALRELSIQRDQIKEGNKRLSENNMAGLLGMVANGADQAAIQQALDAQGITGESSERVWRFYRNGGASSTNWDLFYELVENDKKLADINLGAFIDQFAPEQQKELVERKAAIKQGRSADYAGKMLQESLLKRGAEESGMGKWDKLSKEKKAKVKSYLYQREKEITRAKGKFTEEDALALYQEAFRVVPVSDGWFGESTRVYSEMTPEERFGYEMMQLGGKTEENSTAVYDRYFAGQSDRYDTFASMLKKEGKPVIERNMILKLFEYMERKRTALFTLGN